MNGLKMTRIRCNFSISEIAGEVGVTDGEVEEWENGTRAIPSDALEHLSDFFGIGGEYLVEISDEQREYLLGKAMFRHEGGDKLYYNYKPSEPDEDGYVGIFFPEDREITLDEEYIRAKGRAQEVLDNAEGIIRHYDDGTNSVMDRTHTINRRCRVYDRFNGILEGMSNQNLELRVPYFKQIEDVLIATQLAHGIISEEDAQNECETVTDGNYEMVSCLAQILKEDWQETEDNMRSVTERLGKDEDAKRQDSPEPQMSLDEKIAYAENKRREYMGDDYTGFIGFPHL